MPRRATAPFTVAVLLLAGAAPAATAHHAPELAGETRIVASGTSKTKVYLPRAARVAIDVTKSFAAEGEGRLVGLILRENHPTDPDELGFVRLPAVAGAARVYQWGPGAAVSGCSTMTPDPLPPAGSDCTGAKQPTHYTLRRGTYTLYALTDGAPVRLTLRVANLAGTTTLTPGKRVAQGATPMTPTVAQPASWSAGAMITPPARADVFAFATWQSDESAAGSNGSCWYDHADVPAYGFAPGCPAGSSGSFTEVRHPVYGSWGPAKGGRHVLLATGGVTGGGTYGVGGWVAAQNVRDGNGFVYWLGR